MQVTVGWQTIFWKGLRGPGGNQLTQSSQCNVMAQRANSYVSYMCKGISNNSWNGKLTLYTVRWLSGTVLCPGQMFNFWKGFEDESQERCEMSL